LKDSAEPLEKASMRCSSLAGLAGNAGVGGVSLIGMCGRASEFRTRAGSASCMKVGLSLH